MIEIKTNRRYAVTALALTGLLWVYYTLWVIGLPFVDPVYLHYVSWLFPPVSLAFVFPAGLSCLVFMFLFLQALSLVIKERSITGGRKKLKWS